MSHDQHDEKPEMDEMDESLELPESLPNTSGQRTIDALVAQAKDDLRPKLDDAALGSLEAKLMARVREEANAPVERTAPTTKHTSPSPVLVATANEGRRGRVLRFGALALAAAAAVAVFVRRDPAPPAPTASTGTNATAVAAHDEGSASALRKTEGAGEVRIAGAKASAGHVLRGGEGIEAENARAILERPNKVLWLIEPADGVAVAPSIDPKNVARARVTTAGESLALALESGAIEAQVTPVPSGEAFAVDVSTETKSVRIAVHGTHLRVGRNGSRVVVDLTEGVVSIGTPPRAGSTYGTLVTAPAHVELDANDLEGTLRIDHTPGSVRAAVAFSITASTAALAAGGDVPPGSPPKSITPPPAVPPALSNGQPVATGRPADQGAAAVSPGAAGALVPPDTTKLSVPPREAIAAAVRECARAKSRSGDVRVTVTSSLRLKVGAKGNVEQAQFDPPLQPEIQTCAAAAIYKVKLEEGAASTTTIPIEFSY